MTEDRPVGERWTALGELLAEARRSARLSKREAARRAGFADVTWRQLEAGQRNLANGIIVPVNPTDATLEAAAVAVGLEPSEVFAVVGRKYTLPPRRPPVSDDGLEPRVTRLEGQMETVLSELRWIADKLRDEPGSPT